MRRFLLVVGLALAGSGNAQPRGKPLGTWDIEYEHTVSSMHSEPRKEAVHGRMTLRSVGDSIHGELTIGDSATANRSVLRGLAHRSSYALHVEDAPASGFGIFFSALGVAMDWLRENVHGIHPVAVRFELTARGDSLIGSRIATGGMSATPRTSSVIGRRVSGP